MNSMIQPSFQVVCDVSKYTCLRDKELLRINLKRSIEWTECCQALFLLCIERNFLVLAAITNTSTSIEIVLFFQD